MSKIIEKRIVWDSSTSPDVVGYKLYWSLTSIGNPTYDSDSIQTDKTEIIIPTDIPSFPIVENDFIFGVSAIDDVGNESDITLTGPIALDFVVPDAPEIISVEGYVPLRFSSSSSLSSSSQLSESSLSTESSALTMSSASSHNPVPHYVITVDTAPLYPDVTGNYYYNGMASGYPCYSTENNTCIIYWDFNIDRWYIEKIHFGNGWYRELEGPEYIEGTYTPESPCTGKPKVSTIYNNLSSSSSSNSSGEYLLVNGATMDLCEEYDVNGIYQKTGYDEYELGENTSIWTKVSNPSYYIRNYDGYWGINAYYYNYNDSRPDPPTTGWSPGFCDGPPTLTYL